MPKGLKQIPRNTCLCGEASETMGLLLKKKLAEIGHSLLIALAHLVILFMVGPSQNSKEHRFYIAVGPNKSHRNLSMVVITIAPSFQVVSVPMVMKPSSLPTSNGLSITVALASTQIQDLSTMIVITIMV